MADLYSLYSHHFPSWNPRICDTPCISYRTNRCLLNLQWDEMEYLRYYTWKFLNFSFVTQKINREWESCSGGAWLHYSFWWTQPIVHGNLSPFSSPFNLVSYFVDNGLLHFLIHLVLKKLASKKGRLYFPRVSCMLISVLFVPSAVLSMISSLSSLYPHNTLEVSDTEVAATFNHIILSHLTNAQEVKDLLKTPTSEQPFDLHLQHFGLNSN